MLRRKALFGLSLLALIVLLALALRSGQIIESLGRLGDPKPNPTKPLGQLRASSGLVQVKSLHEGESRAVAAPAELRHLDTLEVGVRSTVEVSLDSGYALEAQGPALLQLSLWNPDLSASPVLVNVAMGSVRLMSEGENGQLYVINYGRWTDPKGLDQVELRRPTPGLTIQDKTADKDKPSEDPPNAISEPSSDETSKRLRQGARPNNDEIDRAVARWASDFQKCQSHALREGRPAKGKLLIAIVIQPSGEFKAARVVSSDLNDPTMQSCALQVFERIRMTPFEGEPIERTYPLSFE